MKKEIYIGLMSGTSLDAVDAALVEFLPENKINIIGTHSRPIPAKLKAEILALCTPGPNGVYRMGRTDIELGNEFSCCVAELIQKNQIALEHIVAIGSHGQTIRHMPNEDVPFTIQIGDPNIITKVTGITTVADFRRRDMAYGGQAAPLSPAFHQYLFQVDKQNRFIINIGGIANLTFLPKNRQQKVTGFDTGPGNTLLDAWCNQHTGNSFDNNGDWAKSGILNKPLLEAFFHDSYFKQAPPKSTGREHFNLGWLTQYIDGNPEELSATEVQATLTELTAISIADAVLQTNDEPTEVFICGGGAHNAYLMQRIQANLPKHIIATTQKIGLDPNWVEAVTFAWLARQTIKHQPGNLPSVTGATKHTILGAIYPTSTH